MKDERGTKRPWEKPQLIIIVRSKPEEAVLHACKTGTLTYSSGPDTWYIYCGHEHSCGACSAEVAS